MKKLSLLICIVAISACTTQTQVMIGTPMPTTPHPTSIPTNTTSKEDDHNYSTKDFSFTYPQNYSIQNESDSEVVWQAEFNPGEVIKDELFLKIQKKPFAEMQSGTALLIENFKGEVVSLDEDTTITVDNKQMNKFTYSCGVDCYYSSVRFQVGANYYELTQNVAGGGLSRKFDTMVDSIKFK